MKDEEGVLKAKRNAANKMKPSQILDSALFKSCINSKLVTLKTFLNIFEIFE